MSQAEWNRVVAIDERLKNLESLVDKLVGELARLQQAQSQKRDKAAA